MPNKSQALISACSTASTDMWISGCSANGRGCSLPSDDYTGKKDTRCSTNCDWEKMRSSCCIGSLARNSEVESARGRELISIPVKEITRRMEIGTLH